MHYRQLFYKLSFLEEKLLNKEEVCDYELDFLFFEAGVKLDNEEEILKLIEKTRLDKELELVPKYYNYLFLYEYAGEDKIISILGKNKEEAIHNLKYQGLDWHFIEFGLLLQIDSAIDILPELKKIEKEVKIYKALNEKQERYRQYLELKKEFES